MQLWEDGVIFSEDYTIDEEKRFLYSLVEPMGQAPAEEWAEVLTTHLRLGLCDRIAVRTSTPYLDVPGSVSTFE